jgi:chromatin remodeling complex protein RSC6
MQSDTTPTESTQSQAVSFDQLLAAAESQCNSLYEQLSDARKGLALLKKGIHKSGKKQQKKEKVETLKNVSKELATFMKLEQPMTSRSLAIKAVSAYTKEHNLQCGKNFKVDNLLSTLLQLEKDSVHTYISINGRLSHHFV